MPQPSTCIRRQQQVVRATSISWHSQSSTISTGLGRALADATFLSFLRSYFSCVPQNSMVPTPHLNRLILFLPIYPNRVIPMLTLCWRHRHSPDLEMAVWCFLPLTYYFSHHFWQKFSFPWFVLCFCALIWLIYLTPAKHRGSVIFREICND